MLYDFNTERCKVLVELKNILHATSSNDSSPDISFLKLIPLYEKVRFNMLVIGRPARQDFEQL